MEKEKIYCFDFDGTLTKKDTLIEFIKYTKGTTRFLMGFLLYSPLLVLMKLHLADNGKVKERVFRHFFDGMGLDEFDRLCRDFAATHLDLLRPQGIKRVSECLAQGDRVIVMSASIDNWVKPFFSQPGLEGVEVEGTRIEVVDGKVTGRFTTPNCYGAEKVNRLRQAVGDSPCEEAYGDSRGDRELLAYARKGIYKPFREQET